MLNSFVFPRYFSSTTSSWEGKKLPEPPTNCCNSGCMECVWVLYAEDLLATFSDKTKGKEQIKTIIAKEITDPNMKEYLFYAVDNEIM